MKPSPCKARGGVARWSLHHPVAVVMLTLAVAVLGLTALARLKIDLLPHILYPSIAVRVNDPGVPARIMEDEVTRQLEEQLAITENAVFVRSATREGRSAVDLDFQYGTDMDAALRDASTRLDRARRFLPETVQPPVIYKRDPSQLPAMELAIASDAMDPVALRQWVDYVLSKWLITLPGVAAAEVAGGLAREIQVQVHSQALAARGLDVAGLVERLREENRDRAGGRLRLPGHELPVQTLGRFRTLDALASLPVPVTGSDGSRHTVPLAELAQVRDSHEEPRLRIRLDGRPAVKLSIQKQPQANTVEVVDRVRQALAQLRSRGQIPRPVQVQPVADEARHVRAALNNALQATGWGALLAMAVVWLFLGDLRRTLVIGSAIPVATLVALALMAAGGLTLNLMTLGGLALGIGLLVDSTIVMLENIHRHQRLGEAALPAAERAAGEVTSAIVASTTTNLAAVVPFLFVGGLVGLLFQGLILTLSAAILAALAVALTLVPALAGRLRPEPAGSPPAERFTHWLQRGYAWLLPHLLRLRWGVLLAFCAALAWSAPPLSEPLARFLPRIDDGRIGVYLTADRGTSPEQMDRITRRVEAWITRQPGVASVFTTVGGFTFGRSRYETAHRAFIQVQLQPPDRRPPAARWIRTLRAELKKADLAGVRVRIRQRGIRGLRLDRSGDDLAFKIQGPDLAVLDRLARAVEARLEGLPGLRNLKRSNEQTGRQLSIEVDRAAAARLGLDTATIARTVRRTLEGEVVGRFLDGDRSVPIRLRLLPGQTFPVDLDTLILMGGPEGRTPVTLGQVARVRLDSAPDTIVREQQQRIAEVTATLEEGASLSQVVQRARQRLAGLELPAGYSLYEGGSLETLRQGRSRGLQMLGLALFLVLVVLAVQYESLRDPLVILFSVPFGLIGVALGLQWTDTPLTMPVWLGLILLAGIVVNNAILLVEFARRERADGRSTEVALVEAGRLRLRPILMTTLTTVAGLMPLALGHGQGAELLQPLALTLVWGLSFSLLVSLVLVPVTCRVVWAWPSGRRGSPGSS